MASLQYGGEIPGLAAGFWYDSGDAAAAPTSLVVSVSDAGGIASGVAFGTATVQRIGPVVVTPTARIYGRIGSRFQVLPGNQPTVDHDPEASVEYGVEFVDELADGDAITGAPTVLAPGVTTSGARMDGTAALVRCTGGAVGTRAPVEFTVATISGDIHQLTIYLRVVDR